MNWKSAKKVRLEIPAAAAITSHVVSSKPSAWMDCCHGTPNRP